MSILVQRKIISTNTFEIGEKGLKIKEKRFGSYNEVEIPFEDITKSTSVSKHRKKSWLYAAIIFLVLTITVIIDNIITTDGEFEAIILYGVISIFTFIMYGSSIKNNRFLVCTDGSVIVFFDNKPTKEILDSFIADILKKRNEYLKSKYTKIDYDFPIEDQLYRFRWLNEQDIITEQEFNDYKGKLLKDVSNEEKKIGFTN